MYQAIPIARERQLEDNAHHTVVVVLNVSFETLTAFENKRIDLLDYRWPLIANIGWRRMLQARLLHGTSAHRLLQDVESEFLAHIELNQHQNGAVEKVSRRK